MQNAELPHFASLHSQGRRFSAERGVRSAERLRFTLFRSQGKFFNAELPHYVSLRSQGSWTSFSHILIKNGVDNPKV